MNTRIRDVATADFDRVLELNEAAVPDVNSLTRDAIGRFADIAAYFRVVDDVGIAAFLIGLRPGSSYESPNYRWFCRHYDDFGYVDRVAVDATLRRSGFASALYEDFRGTLPASVPVMTCEVNIEPPNESSMQFHERLGFRQVATQDTEGGAKRVALMERRL